MRNGKAYQRKMEKFFVSEEKSLVRLTPVEKHWSRVLIQDIKSEYKKVKLLVFFSNTLLYFCLFFEKLT